MWYQAALSIFFTLFGQVTDGALDELAHLDCPVQILQYTTGYPEQDVHLYAPGVEWVITDVVRQGQSRPEQEQGYVALVHLVTDGDQSLEGFVLREDELAQVQYQDEWITQEEFESLFCHL